MLMFNVMHAKLCVNDHIVASMFGIQRIQHVVMSISFLFNGTFLIQGNIDQ